MRVIKKKLLTTHPPGRGGVSKLRPSTGIYGRLVGGSRPNNAVRGRR